MVSTRVHASPCQRFIFIYKLANYQVLQELISLSKAANIYLKMLLWTLMLWHDAWLEVFGKAEGALVSYNWDCPTNWHSKRLERQRQSICYLYYEYYWYQEYCGKMPGVFWLRFYICHLKIAMLLFKFESCFGKRKSIQCLWVTTQSSRVCIMNNLRCWYHDTKAWYKNDPALIYFFCQAGRREIWMGRWQTNILIIKKHISNDDSFDQHI